MKKNFNHVVLLFLLSSFILCAQEDQFNLHFSGLISAGISWSGTETWSFHSCNCAPVEPGIGLSAGLQYGPILNLDGALLFSSIEIAYGEESASKTFPEGEVEKGIQQMPIMIWTKVMTASRLSPFLRGGAGIAKTDYMESAAVRNGPTIRFHQWHFIWGLGGGLDYQLDNKMSLEVFIEHWGTEKDLTGINSSGFPDGIYGRYFMGNYGIRGIVAF